MTNVYIHFFFCRHVVPVAYTHLNLPTIGRVVISFVSVALDNNIPGLLAVPLSDVTSAVCDHLVVLFGVGWTFGA